MSEIVVRLVGKVFPVITAREAVHVDPSFEVGRRWVPVDAGIVVGAADEESLVRIADKAIPAFQPLNKRHAVVGSCLFILDGEEAREGAMAILKSNPSVRIDLIQ